MASESADGGKRWVGVYGQNLFAATMLYEIRRETRDFAKRIQSLGVKCLKCGTVHEFATILPPCPNCSSKLYGIGGSPNQITIDCAKCQAGILENVKCECGCVNPLRFDTVVQQVQAKSAGMCFIATAACGDPFATEVIVLSAFRDDVLRFNWFGRVFIRLYYALSPPIANLISRSVALRRAAMVLLVRPAARLVRPRPYSTKR